MTPSPSWATLGCGANDGAARGHDGAATMLEGFAVVVSARPEPPAPEVLDDLPGFSRRGLDELLRPGMAAFVERVVDELDRVMAITVRGGPIETEVRRATEHAVRQFALAVESGSSRFDTRLYRELGRRHARAGWPMDELTAMITRGGRACLRILVDLAEAGDLDIELVGPASEVVLTLTSTVMAAAVDGYAEAGASGPSRLRSRRLALVRRLLRVAELEADVVSSLPAEAADLGWTLPERVVVGITTPGGDLSASLPPQALLVSDGARQLLVAPADDASTTALTVPAGATLALGPPVSWREAGDSAALAGELLALVADGRVLAGGTVRCDDHAAELLLASRSSLADALRRRWLAPLLELPVARREPLLETLAAWLELPGQYTSLAERLHVHVRTVRYRVDRLRVLLGPVVDDPSRRLELSLSLRAAAV